MVLFTTDLDFSILTGSAAFRKPISKRFSLQNGLFDFFFFNFRKSPISKDFASCFLQTKLILPFVPFNICELAHVTRRILKSKYDPRLMIFGGKVTQLAGAHTHILTDAPTCEYP